MARKERTPSKNIAEPVYFILKGAQKRRLMATQKAQSFQRDFGVIPRLKSVK